jgi:hypothetical protein
MEKIRPHTSHQALEVTVNLISLQPAYNPDLTPCGMYFKFKCVKIVIYNWLYQENETFFHSCIIAVLYVGMNVWNLVETNKTSIEILLLTGLLCMVLCPIMRKHFSEKKKI